MTPVAELGQMLERILALRESLSDSTPDCAYAATRAAIALSDLINELEKQGAEQ